MNQKSRVLNAIATFATKHKQRIALISEGRSLTYRALLENAQKLEEQLRMMRVKCLGVVLDNGIEWCVADMAAIMADVVTVPVPLFFSEAQREHALSTAGANALLTWQDGHWHIAPLDYPAACLPQGTAKITFTSGTTGQPKGVCLSQQGLENVAVSLTEVIGVENAQRHLALLPLAVLLENIAGFYATLLAGGCYVVPPLAALGFNGMQPNGAAILHYLASQHITSCIFVPELLKAVLHAIVGTPIALPDLRFTAVGGAKVSPQLLEQAKIAGLPVYEGYGLSESASVVAVNTPAHHKKGSVGKILPHISCSLSNEGELILKKPALLGYVGEPEHSDGYATGDIVRIDEDGYMFITGRKRNVIITSHGRNIAPEWPESELVAEAAIAQAIVAGDAQSYLVALIVPTYPNVDIAKAVEAANQRLPLYARIGDWRVVTPFTPANKLLTTNGRIKRAEVLAQYHGLLESLYSHGEKHGIL